MSRPGDADLPGQRHAQAGDRLDRARTGRCRRRRPRPRSRRPVTCSESPRTAGSPRSSSTSRSATSSSGSPGLAASFSSRKSTSRPTISFARLASVAPSVSTVPTFTPRRSTVTRSAISSTSRSLCEMKMTETPSAVSVRSTLNSSAASCAVSTAVGSSRISTSAPRCSTRRISTRCCWPTPMSSTRARGSTTRPKRSDRSRTRSLGRVDVEQRALARLGRQHDVLGHGHDRDQHEVLVHHPDAHADRLARRADVHRLAAEADLALVGLVQPVEDVHERRLAGSVLPEQGVNLAAAQVEVDVVVRDQRAEALRHALQLEGERMALLGQDDFSGLIGMSVISPDLICSSTSFDLVGVLAARGVGLADPDAAGLGVEDRVLAGLEAAVLDLLGGDEHGVLDLLERRGHHVIAQIALVGVDADALHALLLGGVERAEAALAGHGEDDLGALGDLVERDLLALRLVDEVLRIAVQDLDVGVRLRGTGLVARDVGVDRRDLLAADRRDDLVAALVLRVQARHVADRIAALGLLERQALHVLRLGLHRRLREVDDAEVRRREGVGHLLGRRAHQEAVGHDQVVLLARERREVRHVVGLLVGGEHADLGPELLLGALEALVGGRVEPAVVEAADVGDDADLDLLGGLLGARLRAAARALLVLAARRHGTHAHRQRGDEQQTQKLSGHGTRPLLIGVFDPTPGRPA